MRDDGLGRLMDDDDGWLVTRTVGPRRQASHASLSTAPPSPQLQRFSTRDCMANNTYRCRNFKDQIR